MDWVENDKLIATAVVEILKVFASLNLSAHDARYALTETKKAVEQQADSVKVGRSEWHEKRIKACEASLKAREWEKNSS